MPTNKKSPIRVEAERLCKEIPDAQTRTLARRLAKEFGVTVEQARSIVRDVRGAMGDKRRKETKDQVRRPHQKAGWRPAMPPSKAEDWTPFALEGQRIACLSDIHVPYHCERALAAAVKECRRRKADTLLLNGDALDFYSISRWIKDPRKRDFKAELDSAQQLLQWIRAQFAKARIVFKVGNHEDRWDHYLWNHAPEICDLPNVQLPQILEMDDLAIEYVDNERPCMAGKLPIFHGHELPRGLTNPVNMARGAFLRMCDTVLVGHGHRTSTHTEPSWEHDETTTWSQGCLCDMNPRYARINKWNHGFAFVDVGADGDFDLTNYRINSDGKVRQS